MKRFFPVFFIILLLSCGLWAQHQQPEREPTNPLRQLFLRVDSGDPKALYQLAYLYDTGFDSIEVDSVKSTELYRRAAQAGFPPAMNFLGFRFFKGEFVDKDVDSALFWIRKAALAGDITAAANLGYLLSESDEFPNDMEEAVKWLTIAAREGVKEAQLKLIDIRPEHWNEITPDSALILGLDYYSGKAPILGTFFLQQAADAGSPKAQALLGDAYSKGLGVPYNHQKSIDYFFEAANGGDPSAQFIIAEWLEFFPDNNDNSLHDPNFWFESAAKQGVVDSESAFRRLLSLP